MCVCVSDPSVCVCVCEFVWSLIIESDWVGCCGVDPDTHRDLTSDTRAHHTHTHTHMDRYTDTHTGMKEGL